ncbi:NAD-dependent epimerase/dehydratase family protein [Pseudogulbenkiania subflava]|uniref:NAD(P)H-binding n=1 Tax=Pseudogulbenkiania subflava DSM 22618 TaxID=1123014 RepID=A0A1Y6CAJ1_9NEIS|nr:NAD-dependent epimerase/dehydratase family protein [Pseudogulbenkiania subflava]SMF44649.1 NAD(P)H-binding [Pseudogulbenkiania subflava DSM 22618]
MMTSPAQRKVLLAGASGLVGSQILRELLANTAVAEVHVLGRRSITSQHPKLHVHIVDFSRLPVLPAVDEVYLALGATIKVAGSQTAFRAVDYAANLAVAKAALVAGAKRIGLVSALGANADSRVFYNRVKGELEVALQSLAPDALVIARPSLLLGDRDSLHQPLRIGEKLSIPIAKLLAPVLPGPYRPVTAQSVARALLRAVPGASGVVVLASDALARIGHE